MSALLALHAVRLKGMADTAAVAKRFALDDDTAAEDLLDAQAFGWVAWAEFAGMGGWSLTKAGRDENERQLAAELEQVDGGAEVFRVEYEHFLPLNARLLQACTDWQIRPTSTDALAANDHRDEAWNGRVVEELTALGDSLRPLSGRLMSVLSRFGGYDARFAGALERVVAGDQEWVNGTGQDSCHTVWFELHEDLLATLGLERS
jgi:hypothetical protein